MDPRTWLTWIALLTALTLGILAPAGQAMTCTDHLQNHSEDRPDLSPWIPKEQITGRPVSDGKWLLGEGSEAKIFRLKTKDGFKVRKVHESIEFAEVSHESIRHLQSIKQSAFKVIHGGALRGKNIDLPWIEGVTLDFLLNSSEVPPEIKDALSTIYRRKLFLLVQDMISHHPEYELDIFLEPEFIDIAKKFKQSENLKFKEINLPSEIKKLTPVRRFMIDTFPKGMSAEEKEEFIPHSLEPKTDNIVVNPKTWEMTWIDPN